MFCSECGKQLPDNSKFCNFCGAKQVVISQEPAAEPVSALSADSASEKGKQAPEKKTNIIAVLAVLAAAFVLGKFVIAPAISGDKKESSENGGSKPAGSISYEYEKEGDNGSLKNLCLEEDGIKTEFYSISYLEEDSSLGEEETVISLIMYVEGDDVDEEIIEEMKETAEAWDEQYGSNEVIISFRDGDGSFRLSVMLVSLWEADCDGVELASHLLDTSTKRGVLWIDDVADSLKDLGFRQEKK